MIVKMCTESSRYLLYVLGDFDTAAEAAGRAMIGRPAEYSIERDEFAEACAGGLNELELVAHFGGRLNSVIDGDWRSAQFRD